MLAKMADLPTQLPKPLPETARVELQRKVYAHLVRAVEDWAQGVHLSTDNRDKKDFVQWGTKFTGLEPREDSHANLATIAITIEMGNGSAPTIEAREVPTEIEDATIVSETESAPAEAPDAQLATPDEPEDFLLDLNALDLDDLEAELESRV